MLNKPLGQHLIGNDVRQNVFRNYAYIRHNAGVGTLVVLWHLLQSFAVHRSQPLNGRDGFHPYCNTGKSPVRFYPSAKT